ncbi:hypothetical protein GMRT_16327 [Giardia muris]|uniref:Uncharacterized protein n=1 Tax=Giardia muris TaxID=5742 RepID=A0A4Z1T6I4_GIAMU|nr:hypothetical protein GMRT_16327 [Giardia muris]|eukprot:TNJ29673.1 hypothetical protein GMRT_16327 [Giardia muris]
MPQRTLPRRPPGSVAGYRTTSLSAPAAAAVRSAITELDLLPETDVIGELDFTRPVSNRSLAHTSPVSICRSGEVEPAAVLTDTFRGLGKQLLSNTHAINKLIEVVRTLQRRIDELERRTDELTGASNYLIDSAKKAKEDALQTRLVAQGVQSAVMLVQRKLEQLSTQPSETTQVQPTFALSAINDSAYAIHREKIPGATVTALEYNVRRLLDRASMDWETPASEKS